MIIVHHLENSRSQRVLWLLEALNVEYKVKSYKRDPKTGLAPKELLAVHPLGKSPLIDDGGIIIAESGAIFQYLLQKFDKDFRIHPSGSDSKHQDLIFWLHFSEGSLMWPLVIRLLHQKVIEKSPFFISPVAKLIFKGIEKAYLSSTINKAFQLVEDSLNEKSYLLGDHLSAADIMMSFPLEAACAGRNNMDNFPNIKKFVKTIKLNKDYQKAITLGGKYDY